MTTAVTDLSLQKYVPVLQGRKLMFSACSAAWVKAAKRNRARLTFWHTALRSAASLPETCCLALQVLLLPLKWEGLWLPLDVWSVLSATWLHFIDLNTHLLPSQPAALDTLRHASGFAEDRADRVPTLEKRRGTC